MKLNVWVGLINDENGDVYERVVWAENKDHAREQVLDDIRGMDFDFYTVFMIPEVYAPPKIMAD